MSKYFEMGGWGMYPTTLFGLLLVAAGLAYAVLPERRFVPLLVSMGVVTFGSGLLGATMGIIRTFAFIGELPAGDQYPVTLAGISESLVNVVWAFIFLVLAMLSASVGALRLGLRARPQAELGAAPGGRAIAHAVGGAVPPAGGGAVLRGDVRGGRRAPGHHQVTDARTDLAAAGGDDAMDCKLISGELVAYHFGQVDDAARARVEDHLFGCSDCLRSFLVLKREIETAATAPRPSAAARAKLRRAVALEVAPRKQVRPVAWWRRPLAFGFAAAACAASMLMVVSVRGQLNQLVELASN
jgi:hypothetical protein